MKIAIFGGTGPLGKQLVEQALEAGHKVTVLARTPDKLGIEHRELTVYQGDVLNPDDVAYVVQDADAVLSALGIRRLGYSTTVSEGTRHILKAMYAHDVKRFLCVTSVGVNDSRPQARTMGFLYHRILLPIVLRQSFDDKERQEHIITQSQIEWTIIRPTSLINDKLTQSYTVTDEKDFSIKGDISRADVAHFMLEAIHQTELVGQAVTVSY